MAMGVHQSLCAASGRMMSEDGVQVGGCLTASRLCTGHGTGTGYRYCICDPMPNDRAQRSWSWAWGGAGSWPHARGVLDRTNYPGCFRARGLGRLRPVLGGHRYRFVPPRGLTHSFRASCSSYIDLHLGRNPHFRMILCKIAWINFLPPLVRNAPRTRDIPSIRSGYQLPSLGAASDGARGRQSHRRLGIGQNGIPFP